MLLSHFTVSGLGIVVITIWTWFIQLRTKEAMSEGDGGEHRVEVTSDTSPQSEALSSQEGRHSRQICLHFPMAATGINKEGISLRCS